VIGSDDGKPPSSSDTTKPKTPVNIGVFKPTTPSPDSSSPLSGEKSEDSYFI
jgi:hypothetical protein